MRFLSFIFDLLLPRRATARTVDEINKEEFLGLMVAKEVAVPFCSSTGIALLPYHSLQVQACVIEAKFHANRKAIGLLGAVLSKYLEGAANKQHADSNTGITLIPTPLSKIRRKERGHNQVESIIRSACTKNSLEKVYINTSLLVRVKNTAPQTTLSGSNRRRNIQAAFSAPRVLSPHHTYILVDDVTTTGSTLAEAARSLQGAGAFTLLVVALADAS